ncbi:hypothetical protein BDV29DRAFT_152810 [Aspergillus leporis]|uniref:Uncharacterized protein n=1 Tax=Aspergillus leporis TaxID=41062 RepID=A0A5N5XCT9_9EURO|nr:hypothetical protein BDV29DRAFT_152810 [Aspergillus leporis]
MGLHPVEVLAFFSELGAWIEQPGPVRSRESRKGHTWKPAPWGLGLLLNKCEVGLFDTTPTFQATVQYILRRATANGYIGEDLARYRYSAEYRKRTPEAIVQAWQSLLTYVLEDLKVDTSLFLPQYLLRKIRWLDHLRALERATINRLLAAGADINGVDPTTIKNGSTIDAMPSPVNLTALQT